jgi:hypothetical protein
MAGHSSSKGTLNYTCSFYPTYPTWDPDDDEDEKEKEEDMVTPNGVSRTASIKTTDSKAASNTHQRALSGGSAVTARSENAGTIPSMKTGEADLAKQLEKNELQQVESIPEKKPIEKIKINVDDLQQYGREHHDEGSARKYGWLSWLFPTCSLTPRIFIR